MNVIGGAAERFGIPLISVQGGSGFQGPACMAHTQHGFKGREEDVMRAIGEIMRSGRAASASL